MLVYDNSEAISQKELEKVSVISTLSLRRGEGIWIGTECELGSL